jgi:hypothetical protein
MVRGADNIRFGAVVERETVQQIVSYYFPGESYVESWKTARV